METQYAQRDIEELGLCYYRHLAAMTAERLHTKTSIATELAYRDMEIVKLTMEVEDLRRDVRIEIETLKNLLLKSERIFDDGLFTELGDIVMPFGKYSGKRLSDIPLKYLDGTVSVMPKTWLVRRVIELVDLVYGSGVFFEILECNSNMTANQWAAI